MPRPRSSHRAGRTVRPLDSGDSEGFLELYDAVWDETKAAEWFEWRFRGAPCTDDVLGIVVEADGQIVGAEPLLPFRLRLGDDVVDALQPVDWMVHPEHRRSGHASRMTEALLDRYADEARLLFNFPNAQLLPCLESFGWQVVGDAPRRCRIARPGELARQRGRSLATLARLTQPAVRACHGALDLRSRASSGVAVERHDPPAVDVVADIYREQPPERAHVPRDSAYVEWRVSNPRWDAVSYVAYDGDEPVASVVVATESHVHGTLTRLVDVQPMLDPDRSRAAAFEALLDAVLADADDSTIISAPTRPYPGVLRRRGFFREDSRPLSWFTSARTLAVRPLGDAAGVEDRESVGGTEAVGAAPDDGETPTASTDGGETSCLTVGGRDLSDPDAWLLLPADQDVA